MTGTRTMVDTMITNAEIFTGDRSTPHIPDGAIAVKDGRIVEVGTSKDLNKNYYSKDNIDVSRAIVHPGMIDTHLHAISVVLHGLPVMTDAGGAGRPSYAAIKVSTDDQSSEALSIAAGVALLRRGYTCFMEAGTVLETDAFASGLQKLGMRGMVSAPFGWDDVSTFETHFPGVLSKRLLERAPADTEVVLQRLEKEVSRNVDPDQLVTGYVCLYGEGSSTDTLIEQASQFARRSSVLYNQHQGFVKSWHEFEREKFGRTGVERLNRLGALHEKVLLSHMNVMTDHDEELVLQNRPGITWCPTMAIQREVHPSDPCRLPGLAKKGISISLGMDTTMVNPLGTAGTGCILLSSMIGERLDEAEPFYMQTVNAARNIGREDDLGSISVGKRADIVVRRSDDITHTALDQNGTVLALSSAQIPVSAVMIGGTFVMKEGELTKIDQERELHNAIKQRNRVLDLALS